MKTIGIRSPASDRWYCSSKPSMPGIRTSRIRHAVSSREREIFRSRPPVWNSEHLGHADQLSDGLHLHLSHDVTAMELDCSLSSADFVGDFLIEHARDHTFKHLALARVERFVASAQVRIPRMLLACDLVAFECVLYCIEQNLIAEWFGEKFDRTGFHGLDRHWNIAVTCNENNRYVDAGLR